jgi:hypothetical protein
MKLSMTSTKASNWVDRGEHPVPKIQRTLMFFYDRHDAADAAWLREAAQTLVGMVEADSSEVLVAGYLKYVASAQAIEFPSRARLASAAVWHIAKAALVRDAAERLLNSDLVHQRDRVPQPLSAWLAERLLTPDELERLGAAQDAERPDVAR